MGYLHVVPSVFPVTSDGVAAGRWICLKDYERVSVVLTMGAAAGATQTLRLRQARDTNGTGASALNFEAVWLQGARLNLRPNTLDGRYQVGETVTGANGGSAVVHSVHADHLIVHTHNGTAFVAEEEVTGGTSGATADLLAAGFFVDSDILCREKLVAPTDTFEAPAVANQVYAVEIKGADLDTNNDYDCIQADISAVGAAVDTAKAVSYVLGHARYKNEPMLSAV